MSIPQAKEQTTFLDVAVMVEGLFSGNNRYRLFREKILPTLQGIRQELCGLYCEDNGRPAVEPVIALGATLLQFMEKVPDRKAAENMAMHLGWKYALDMEIDEKGFHYSSLCNFRDRLVDGDAKRIAFDSIAKALREAGIVRKNSKQRLDSTHIIGNVSAMSRLECVRESIRLFIEFVERKGFEDRLRGFAEYKERYCQSQVQWHRLDKKTLKEKAVEAGGDALKLIRWARRQPAVIRDHDKTLMLERVFVEQYEPGSAALKKKDCSPWSSIRRMTPHGRHDRTTRVSRSSPPRTPESKRAQYRCRVCAPFHYSGRRAEQAA
jgi:transposase